MIKKLSAAHQEIEIIANAYFEIRAQLMANASFEIRAQGPGVSRAPPHSPK